MSYFPYAQELGARYALTADGLSAVFNDQSSPDYVGVVTEVGGLDGAEVRESADDIVEGDGGRHGAFYFGRRPVTFTVMVLNPASALDRATRLDKLRRVCTAGMRSDISLSWIPTYAGSPANYSPNPSAEISAISPTGGAISAYIRGTGGSGGSATASRITTDAAPGGGSSCAEYVATTKTGATVNYITMTAQTLLGLSSPMASAMPVAPGNIVSLRTYVKTLTALPSGSRLDLRAYWFNSSGAGLSTTIVSGTGSVPSVTDPTINTWYEVFGTATVPAGVAYCTFIVETSPDLLAATSYTLRMDRNMVSKVSATTTYPTYVDGDSALHAWGGATGLSWTVPYVEMYTPVRLQQPLREQGNWQKSVSISLVSEFAPLFSKALRTSPTIASGGSAVLENQGGFPAAPVLRVTGATTAQTIITNTTTGKVLKLVAGYTIPTGQVRVIDVVNQSMTDTGGVISYNDKIDYAASTWPTLASGNNTFTLTGGGSLVVEWRDTWA